MTPDEVAAWQGQVARLEAEGKATRTFRRLDPERQLAVIGALLEDAAEHGPSAVSVKRVAERAGVAVGSLYQYFPQREAMLSFAAELAAGFLTSALDGYRGALAALPLREALRAYLAGGVEWSREHQALLRFFARAAYHGEPAFLASVVRPVATSMRGLVRAMLQAARDRGELRPDVELEAAVRFVHATSIALGDAELLPHLDQYYLLFERQPARARAGVREEFLDLVLRALAVSEKGGGHGRRRARG